MPLQQAAKEVAKAVTQRTVINAVSKGFRSFAETLQSSQPDASSDTAGQNANEAFPSFFFMPTIPADPFQVAQQDANYLHMQQIWQRDTIAGEPSTLNPNAQPWHHTAPPLRTSFEDDALLREALLHPKSPSPAAVMANMSIPAEGVAPPSMLHVPSRGILEQGASHQPVGGGPGVPPGPRGHQVGAPEFEQALRKLRRQSRSNAPQELHAQTQPTAGKAGAVQRVVSAPQTAPVAASTAASAVVVHVAPTRTTAAAQATHQAGTAAQQTAAPLTPRPQGDTAGQQSAATSQEGAPQAQGASRGWTEGAAARSNDTVAAASPHQMPAADHSATQQPVAGPMAGAVHRAATGQPPPPPGPPPPYIQSGLPAHAAGMYYDRNDCVAHHDFTEAQLALQIQAMYGMYNGNAYGHPPSQPYSGMAPFYGTHDGYPPPPPATPHEVRGRFPTNPHPRYMPASPGAIQQGLRHDAALSGPPAHRGPVRASREPQHPSTLGPKQLTSFITSKYRDAIAVLHRASQGPHWGHSAAIQGFVRDVQPMFSNGQLNSIHLAAVMTRIAHLLKAAGQDGHADNPLVPSDLLSAVERKFLALPMSSDHQSLTNLLWAFSVTRHRCSPDFLNGILDNLEHLGLSSVEPQGLSNVVYALGKMDLGSFQPKKDTLDAFMRVAVDKLHELCPQDISNLMLGAAGLANGSTRYQPNKDVLDALAQAALRQLQEHPIQGPRGNFTSQGVGNTLWAYAKLNHSPLDGQFVSVMMDHMTSHMRDFSCQELVNSLWAASHLHPSGVSATTLKQVEGHAAKDMHKYLAMQVSALLGAFATLRYVPHSKPFGDALELHLRNDARDKSMSVESANINANVVHSLGKLQMKPTQATLNVLRQRQNALVTSGHPRPQSLIHFEFGMALMDALTPADLSALHKALAPSAASLSDSDLDLVFLMACLAGTRIPPSPPGDREDCVWPSGLTQRPDSAHRQTDHGLDLDSLGPGAWQLGGSSTGRLTPPRTALPSVPAARSVGRAQMAVEEDGMAWYFGPTASVGPSTTERQLERRFDSQLDLEAPGLWQIGPSSGLTTSLAATTMSPGSLLSGRDWLGLQAAAKPVTPMAQAMSVLQGLPVPNDQLDDLNIWQYGAPQATPAATFYELLLQQLQGPQPQAQQQAVQQQPVEITQASFQHSLWKEAQEHWKQKEAALPLPPCWQSVAELLALLELTWQLAFMTEDGIRVDFAVTHSGHKVAILCCNRDDFAVNDNDLLVNSIKVMKHKILTREGYRVALLREDTWLSMLAEGERLMYLVALLEGAGLDMMAASRTYHTALSAVAAMDPSRQQERQRLF